jgi:hypothetical protein
MLVIGVLHELEKGDDELYLYALHDSILGLGNGDAISAECLDHIPACRILTTQDGYVTWSDWCGGFVTPATVNLHLAFKHFLYLEGKGIGCFLLIIDATIAFPMNDSSGGEVIFLEVGIELYAQLFDAIFLEGLIEHIIDKVNELLSGTPALNEAPSGKTAWTFLFMDFCIRIECEVACYRIDKVGTGSTESIDRLFGVAHPVGVAVGRGYYL